MFRRITGKPPQPKQQQQQRKTPQTIVRYRGRELSPPMDWNQEFERWLRVEAEHNEDGVSIDRYRYQRSNYGRLINKAKRAGRTLRDAVGSQLYHNVGAPWTPLDDEPLPFSPEAIVREACNQMLIPGYHVLFTDSDAALDETRLEYSRDLHHEIHAWILSNADGRLPLVFVNLSSPSTSVMMEHCDGELRPRAIPLWTIHLALCLFVLHEHFATHVGYAVPGGQVILPPLPHRERNVVPIAHMFVKALLGTGGPRKECPRQSTCECNHVLEDLRRLPQYHREMTGPLSFSTPPAYARPAPPTRPINSGEHPRHTPNTPTMPTPPPVPTNWLQQLEDADPHGWGDEDDGDDEEGLG